MRLAVSKQEARLRIFALICIWALSLSPSLSLAGSVAIFSGEFNDHAGLDVLILRKRVSFISSPGSTPAESPTTLPLVRINDGIVIYSSDSGYYTTVNSPESFPDKHLWETGNYSNTRADIDGDGIDECLLQSRQAGRPSFTVNCDNDDTNDLNQVLDGSTIGYDLGDDDIDAEASDENNDGLDDLIIRIAGQIADVLLSATGGIFSPPSKNDSDGSLSLAIDLVWTQLNAAIDVGDPTGAASFFTSDAYGRYLNVFIQLGPAFSKINDTWTTLSRVHASREFAEYAFIQDVSGEDRVYFTVFIRNEAGFWSISGI